MAAEARASSRAEPAIDPALVTAEEAAEILWGPCELASELESQIGRLKNARLGRTKALDGIRAPQWVRSFGRVLYLRRDLERYLAEGHRYSMEDAARFKERMEALKDTGPCTPIQGPAVQANHTHSD